MNAKTIFILAGLATVAIAGSLLVTGGASNSDQGAAAEGALFSDLKENINDVNRIVLRQGADEIEVGIQDGEWVLLDRGGFPARFEMAKEVLLQLANLEISEIKTAKPEHFERLGLVPPSAETGSRQIELFDASGARVAAILIGNSTARDRDSSFVQRNGEDQCYQVKGRLSPSARIDAWAEREIIKLGAADIAEVTISQADGTSLVIARDPLDPARTPGVLGVPDGRELSDPGSAMAVFGILGDLKLDDVSSAQALVLEDAVTTTFRCNNGLVLQFRLAQVEGRWWMALSASQDESLIPIPTAPASVAGPVEAPAEGEESATDDAALQSQLAFESALNARAATLAQSRARAEELNTSHSPWAYAIPAHHVTNLTHSMDGLLKSLEDPTTEGGEIVPPGMDQAEFQRMLQEAGIDPSTVSLPQGATETGDGK